MNDAPNRGTPVATGLEVAASPAVPLGAAAVGVIVLDPSGRIVAMNPGAEEILQNTADQWIGQPALALGNAFQQCVADALGGMGAVRREVLLGPPADSIVTVSATVSRSLSGASLFVVAEVQSAERVHAIAANLEQLDRLAGLGTVTAGVAHEIKNALVAVRTFFDLLEVGESDAELRATATGEVQRIERTIRQLLRGARQAECSMAPLSAHALLQDAMNLVRHDLQNRQIVLESHLDAVTDRVMGDERQLRQMIVNLLVNAAEAMPDGGQLTVSTDVVEAWEREHVSITISDTGLGIPAEHLPRLFSPFFTTKPDGTGLGLAISHRIVTAHNGAVQVESEPGQGTTFRVLLPLR